MHKVFEDTFLYMKSLKSEIIGMLSFKQIELDKTAEDFRRVHQERQEVIRQWENAIQQMQKRDQQINHCALVRLLLIGFISISAYFFIYEIDRNFDKYTCIFIYY